MKERKAVFSECGQYRYTLWRTWERGLFDTWPAGTGYVNFICLNPSTATDTEDDNTIRKLVKFARRWGYEALCVTNIFAYRATDPAVMKRQADPVGPENDRYIKEIAAGAGLVVAAWSQHAKHRGRSDQVRQLLAGCKLHYLYRNGGEPHHPLYLPDNLLPTRWEV